MEGRWLFPCRYILKKLLTNFQRYLNHLLLCEYYTQSKLLDYAIKKNDIAAVKFLVQQYKEFPEYNGYDQDPEEKRQFITLSSSHFALAMSLGRTEIMGYLIAKTGAQFPFSNLMNIAGVNVEKKPKVCSDLPFFWYLVLTVFIVLPRALSLWKEATRLGK